MINVIPITHTYKFLVFEAITSKNGKDKVKLLRFRSLSIVNVWVKNMHNLLFPGRKLNKILNAAYEIPIINLEDVYFTYLVSKVKLGLTLTHDHRLSPYRPWLPLPCLYWGLASTHSLSPNEMLCVWPNIEGLGKQYEKGDETCKFYVDNVWSEWYLY